MDRSIDKQPVSLSRWLVIGVASLIGVVICWQVLSRTNSSRLKVDSSRLTTAVVSEDEFLEYYPFDGTVEPATSVYLDLDGGGRVDQIFVEGGQHVEKGDLILRLSNTQLRRTTIDTETQLLYNLDIQRTTLFNRQQSNLVLKDSLLDLDHQILDLEKKYQRIEVLMKDRSSAISVAEFDTMRDQLKYLKDKRVLLAERIRREDELGELQLTQAKSSIERLNTSLGLVKEMVASLDVRAPISGWLSTIDAQVGQNISAGKRIGQVDLLDRFKMRVKIDQYYISRVEVGTHGHVDIDGKSWPVTVQKVYPEVTQSVFAADVGFDDAVPATIKRGQTLAVELTFGAPSRSLTVTKGGFYQQSSGSWAYLVAKDGRSASRISVRLGRQNPRQVEVLEGLRAGDRIITSGYDTFNGVEELRFTETLNPQGTSD